MMLFGSAEEIPAPGADAFTFQGGSNASELGFRQTIEIPGTVVIAAFERLLVLGLEGAVVDAGVAAGGGEGGVEMIGRYCGR